MHLNCPLNRRLFPSRFAYWMSVVFALVGHPLFKTVWCHTDPSISASLRYFAALTIPYIPTNRRVFVTTSSPFPFSTSGQSDIHTILNVLLNAKALRIPARNLDIPDAHIFNFVLAFHPIQHRLQRVPPRWGSQEKSFRDCPLFKLLFFSVAQSTQFPSPLP